MEHANPLAEAPALPLAAPPQPVPQGPWNEEEDFYIWADEATGLPCVALRSPLLNLAGYVGVPAGHPAYGLGPEKLPTLAVHGGAVYSAAVLPSCAAVPPDVRQSAAWWIGFECAQPDDLFPALPAGPGQVYRGAVFVRGQCAGLAQQLQELQAQESEAYVLA